MKKHEVPNTSSYQNGENKQVASILVASTVWYLAIYGPCHGHNNAQNRCEISTSTFDCIIARVEVAWDLANHYVLKAHRHARPVLREQGQEVVVQHEVVPVRTQPCLSLLVLLPCMRPNARMRHL